MHPHPTHRGRLLAFLLPLLAALLCLPAAAQAATFTVNSAGNAHDRLAGDGKCETADDGVCTLRAAIMTANDDDVRDTIDFSLAAGTEIHVVGELPSITKPVLIDGTKAGKPGIVIDGTQLPVDTSNPPGRDRFSVRPPHGLTVKGNTGTTIRGLVVHSFPGAQIALADATGAHVAGNWVGVAADGSTARGRAIEGPIDSAGIFVNDSAASIVGGPGDGNAVAAVERGILVDGGSDGVQVTGNSVGLSADGSTAVPNRHEAIMAISDGGGTRPRNITVASNRVAATGRGDSPATARGIRVNGDDVHVLDNTIGYDDDGDVYNVLTNEHFGVNGLGIRIHDSRRVDVRRNRIAGSAGHAIYAEDGRLEQLTFTGNRIGLSFDGTETHDQWLAPTRNEGTGIWVEGANSDTTIGGETAAERNTFAGGVAGVTFNGDAVRPRVLGNDVGYTLDAQQAAPPSDFGVVLQQDGATADAPTDGLVDANRIAGVPGGTALSLHQGSGHLVARNTIGVSAKNAATPGDIGIVAYGVDDVTIGGDASQFEGNRISAMKTAGIALGDDAEDAKIAGNITGVDADGTAWSAFANDIGIYLFEDEETGRGPEDATIGGELGQFGNVVAARRAGIYVDGDDVTGTQLLSNRVGLDYRNEPAFGDYGIFVREAPGTRVGRPGAGNWIASSLRDGVRITNPAAGRFVQGNWIGMAESPEGETREIAENGVALLNADGVVVGIEADDDVEECDADGACNRFGPTGFAGVAVIGDGVGNVVRGNDFTDLTALPIDLQADGPSAIDVGDRDEGPNGMLNQPAGVQVVSDPRSGRHWVTGVVVGDEPGEVTVEIYTQDNAAQLGVGATFLGTAEPDARGRFRAELDQAPKAGVRFTALATSEDEGVSEFARGCGGRLPARGGDSDGDGLCDEWEVAGVDFDEDAVPDLTLPGATVGRRDLYVELDTMEKGIGAAGVDPRPAKSALDEVRRAFAAAPGGGVNLRWMGEVPGDAFGERLPALPRTEVDTRRPGGFDDLQDFRYGSDAATCDGFFGTDEDRSAFDCFARLGARDLTVRYVAAVYDGTRDGEPTDAAGSAASPRAAIVSMASMSDAALRAAAAGDSACLTAQSCYDVSFSYTLMHELGHMLGLRHGGAGDEPHANPAHLSVMSHSYASAGALTPLDYARDGGIVLDESAYDENDPFDLTADQAARGWQPRVAVWRAASEGVPAGCYLTNLRDGRPLNVDDILPFNTIRHALTNTEDDHCLRPSSTQRYEGHEEWSKLVLAQQVPQFGEDLAPARGARAAGAGAAAVAEPRLPDPSRNDADGDGVPATRDVCPGRADEDQQDANGDGIGDACVQDYVPSDLELALTAPRHLAEGQERDVVVKVTQAWPLAAPGATVGVRLPDGVEPAGPARGDGSWDAAAGSWSTGGFASRETRTLTLPVRATAEEGEGEFAAEITAAAADDVDSTPGNGDREEDDQAQRSVELTPGTGSVPQVDVGNARVTEGTAGKPRTLTFRVRLSDWPGSTVHFRATASPGTASPDADYVRFDRELTIPVGEESAIVKVPVTPDALDEPDETVTLTLSEVEGAATGRVTATGTIVDDDKPAAPGDLVAFGCIAAPDRRDACDVEAGGLGGGVRDAALAGEQHLYVASSGAIAHLRRDAATEALTATGCLLINGKGSSAEHVECARLPPVQRPGGGTAAPFDAVAIDRLLASPAGDRLYALLRYTGTGGGAAVASFAVDAATGALTLERCVGSRDVGVACSEAARMPATGVSALALAPGGRQLYVAGRGQVVLFALEESGALAGTSRCAAAGADPAEGCPALIADDERTTALAVSPDGTTVAATAGGVVRTLRRGADGLLTAAAERALPGAARAAWAPDGTMLHVGDAVEGAIHALDPATLQTRSCIDDGDGGSGCAASAAADLSSVGALRVSADGRDLYAVVPSGAVVFRRGGDGALSGGRCALSPSDLGPCGDGEDEAGAQPPAHSALVLDGDESALFAGSGVLDRYLRVTRAPDGNRAPLCTDGGTVGTHPGRAVDVRMTCADPDGDPVTVRVTQPPAGGALDGLVAATGAARYTPAQGFRGTDPIRFRGSDGRAESGDAELRVEVGNRAPVCSDVTIALVVRGTRTLPVSCSDADGDPLTVSVLTPPQRGTLAGLDYTAPSTWTGADQVVVRAHDGWDHSAPATMTFDVWRPELSCSELFDSIQVMAGRTAERRFDRCRDVHGSPIAVSVKRQTGKQGSATVSDGRLRYRARATADGGRDTITLKVVANGGLAYERELGVEVFNPGPVSGPGGCTGSRCRATGSGDVVVWFVCEGGRHRTSAPCRGEMVIITCTGGRCITSGGSGTGATLASASASAKGRGPRARARGRAKVLPGIRGTRLAEGRFTLEAGRRGRVKVRLSASARRQLASRGRIKALVVTRVRQPDGRTVTTRTAITITAPRKGAARGRRGRR